MMASSDDPNRMEGVFSRLRPICVELTQHQTRKNIENLSSAIEGVSDGQLQALQDYVMFPLRLILKAGATAEKTTDLHVDALTCLKTVISRTEIKRWDTLQDMFTCLCILISNPPTSTTNESSGGVRGHSEELKLAVVECLTRVVGSAGLELRSCLYQPVFVPALGHAVSLLLHLLSTETYNKLRSAAARCLLQLVKLEDKATRTRHGDVFASFLPGITLTTTQVITADYKQNHAVTCAALALWIETVVLVMGDENLAWSDKEQNMRGADLQDHPVDHELAQKLSSLRVSRSDSWVETTAGKLGILVNQIVAIASHPKTQVRLGMVEWARQLVNKCRKSMPDATRPALDVLVQLTADEYTSVASRSQEALLDVKRGIDTKQGQKLVELLASNLHDLATRLPRLIRGSNDEQKLSTLILLTGYIQLLGCKVRSVLHSSAHLQRLSMAMVHILELDASQLEIVQEVLPGHLPALPGTQDTAGHPRYYFKHFHDDRILQQSTKLCQVLGYYGDLDLLVDHFIEISHQGTLYQKQVIFIVSEIIRGAKGHKLVNLTGGNDRNKDIIKPMCGSLVCEYLSPENWDRSILSVATPANEVLPSRSLRKYQPDTLLTRASNILHVCLLLDGIAALAEVLGPEFRVHLVDVLYPLMERVAENVAAISTAALSATQSVALACGYSSIEDMVCHNSDYLVNAITLRLRHIERYPRSPYVLQAILTYTTNDILPLFEDIIQEVIEVLDECYDTNAPLILQVLFALVRAIIIWHPSMSQDSVECPHPDKSNISYPAGEDAEQNQGNLLDYLTEYHKTKVTAEGETEFEDTSQPEANTADLDDMPDITDDEQQKETPHHIQIVKQVLERCSHLLSAPDANLRLLVLRTVAEACLAMQSESNELLPLVHKIWNPFVQRFRDDSPLVCLEAVRTLTVIGRTTGDFLVRRLTTSVLPPMVDFLTKQARVSGVHDQQYRFSSLSKQQLAVMDTLASVCAQMKVTECQLQRVVASCLPYLSASQPPHLQQAGLAALRQLAACDADVVWLSLLDLYFPHVLPCPHSFLPFEAQTCDRNDYSDNVSKLLQCRLVNKMKNDSIL